MFAGVAAAQDAAPPVFSAIDSNAVDVSRGVLRIDTTDVTIGVASEGGLAFERDLIGTGWYHNYVGALRVNGTIVTVSLGQRSETFTNNLGTYVSNQEQGSTLTNNIFSWTYTTADGVAYEFALPTFSEPSPWPQVDAFLNTIQMPSGERQTLHYVTVSVQHQGSTINDTRLQSVTNNLGYQLHFEYALNNPVTSGDLGEWKRMTKVTALNNAVDYCNPLASSCTSLSQTWPTATYTQGSGSQYGYEYVTDSLGQQTRYTWDGNTVIAVRRRSSTSADNLTITYSNDRLSSLSNGSATWTYAYSASGNTETTTITDPLLHTRVVVTQNGQVLTDTDGENRTTTFSYDANGRTERVTMPAGNYTEFTYDGRGNVTEVRQVAKSGSGLSDIVSTASFPSSCTNPVTCNLPASTTDPRGYRTDYEYDATHGGVLSVTVPAPSGSTPVGSGTRPQTRFAYSQLYAYYKNSSGSIVAAPTAVYRLTQTSACATSAWSGSACSAGGADETRTTIGYGSAGVANNRLPRLVTSGAGDASLQATVASDYDSVGNLTSVDGPLSGTGDTVTYRYDALRQLTGVIGPDPDASGALKHRAVRYGYNADGQVTSVEQGTVDSPSNPHWSQFTVLAQGTTAYDFIGRPIRQTLVTDSTTRSVAQMSYDAANRLDCAVTRMNSAVFGSLPSSACTLGTEGANGPDRVTRMSYNNADQPTKMTMGYGTAAAIDEWTATYNGNGLNATLADAGGNLTTFVYDGFDRLSRMRFPNASGGGSSASDYEEYSYNAASDVTVTRRRDGATLTAAYDNLRRLTSITPSANGAAISYTYDNFSRTLTSAISGQTLAFTYDQLSRNLSQQSPLGVMSYQYDLARRRTRVTWPDSFYAQYDYNTAGDLTAIRENGASSGAGVLATYTYNDLGQRRSVARGNDVTTNYDYDAALRLEELAHDLASVAGDQTLNFTYNAAGQIVSRIGSNASYEPPAPTGGTTSYADNGLNQYTSAGGASQTYDNRGNLTTGGFGYDIFNRLTSGPNSAALNYDPLGRLYQSQSAAHAATRYLYDGAVIAGEYNASGTLLRRYVHGPHIDEPVVWYEGAGTTDRRWLAADQLGSVIAVTNGAGAASAINRYDAYGVPGTTNAGRFQFTGQAWLPEVSLYHYKARAYSPATGRFLQTDPILFDGGMNLYAYVGNDPVNRIDPFGLQDNDCRPDEREGEECGTIIVTGRIVRYGVTASVGGPGDRGLVGSVDPTGQMLGQPTQLQCVPLSAGPVVFYGVDFDFVMALGLGIGAYGFHIPDTNVHGFVTTGSGMGGLGASLGGSAGVVDSLGDFLGEGARASAEVPGVPGAGLTGLFSRDGRTTGFAVSVAAGGGVYGGLTETGLKAISVPVCQSPSP